MADGDAAGVICGECGAESTGRFCGRCGERLALSDAPLRDSDEPAEPVDVAAALERPGVSDEALPPRERDGTEKRGRRRSMVRLSVAVGLLALVTSVVLIARPAPEVVTAWTARGGFDATGRTTTASTLPSDRQLWRTDGWHAGGSARGLVDVLNVGQLRLIVGRHVVAVDATTFAERWRVPNPAPFPNGLVTDGEQLWTAAGGELLRVDLSDGSVAGRVPLEGLGSAGRAALAVVGEDVVAVGDARVARYEPETGDARWSVKLPEGHNALLGVATDAVVVQRADRRFGVFDLATGTERVLPLELSDIWSGRPVLVEGAVVVPVEPEGALVGIDVRTGRSWTLSPDSLPAAITDTLGGSGRLRLRVAGPVYDELIVEPHYESSGLLGDGSAWALFVDPVSGTIDRQVELPVRASGPRVVTLGGGRVGLADGGGVTSPLGGRLPLVGAGGSAWAAAAGDDLWAVARSRDVELISETPTVVATILGAADAATPSASLGASRHHIVVRTNRGEQPRVYRLDGEQLPLPFNAFPRDAVATPAGTVVRYQDGTVTLYDASGERWSAQVDQFAPDDAEFVPQPHWLNVSAGQIVAIVTDHDERSQLVAIALADGAVSTTPVEVANISTVVAQGSQLVARTFQRQGDQRPLERMSSWQLRQGELTRRWERPAVAHGHLVLDGGRLVVSSAAAVEVIDATTGDRRDRFAVDLFTDLAPALHGDLLVRTSGRTLIAVSLEDGSVAWQQELDGHITTAPTLAGDIVLVGTDTARVVALAADTGQELANARLPGSPSAPIVAAHGRLFVHLDDGSIVALEALDRT